MAFSFVHQRFALPHEYGTVLSLFQHHLKSLLGLAMCPLQREAMRVLLLKQFDNYPGLLQSPSVNFQMLYLQELPNAEQ